MRAEYPLASVEVWAEDEHRAGLKPILRRVWARRGVRPVVRVRPRYEWVWVYAFVHPETGRTEWLMLPRVDKELMGIALERFARAVGAGPRKRVVLVLDQAGWHKAKELRVPEGIHLEFLPAYSPELQPAERLWPLTNEGLANRAFPTIAELERAAADRIVRIKDEVVRRLTRYYWWPRTATSSQV